MPSRPRPKLLHTMHPVRWATTFIVVLVLGWDIWQTLRESRLAPHAPPAITESARPVAPESAPAQSGAQSPD